MSFQEILEQRENAKLAEKLAQIEATYGNDPVFTETFEAAIDLVKEANFDATPSDQLDLAFDLTCDHLNGMTDTTKVASDEIEDARAWGELCAQAAFEAGVTSEDVAKIASDEEGDLFGRMLAVAVSKRLQAE